MSVSHIITLIGSGAKRNVTVCCPSVCPVGMLTMTHQGAACDEASVHFGKTIRRADLLVSASTLQLLMLDSNETDGLDWLLVTAIEKPLNHYATVII